MRTDAAQPAPPKRRRRWFQFNLRTMLLVTLVCALACALLARRIETKRRTREAVDAIIKDGGVAQFDYQIAASDAEPPGPVWLRKAIGENFFATLKVVQFDNWRRWGFGPHLADLSQFDNLSELEVLELPFAKINDDDLRHFKHLTNLRVLDLGESAVTGAALEHLHGLRSLRELNLNGTHITDADLERLRDFSQLETLFLFRCPLTEPAVRELQQALPNCVVFH